jgi:hypothetical protein
MARASCRHLEPDSRVLTNRTRSESKKSGLIRSAMRGQPIPSRPTALPSQWCGNTLMTLATAPVPRRHMARTRALHSRELDRCGTRGIFGETRAWRLLWVDTRWMISVREAWGCRCRIRRRRAAGAIVGRLRLYPRLCSRGLCRVEGAYGAGTRSVRTLDR